jgi:hypothetical protein
MIAIQRLVRHGYDFRAKFGFDLNSAEQGSRITFFSIRGLCAAILAGLRTLIHHKDRDRHAARPILNCNVHGLA